MTAATVAGSTRVRLHDLRVRADGADWVVGRVETGEFIAVPEVAVAALRLLGAGLTVDDTRERLRAEHGRDIDVAGFATSLVGLGFVAAVDDRQVAGPPVPKPTLPALRPGHVRWVLSWPVAATLAVLAAAAAVVLVRRPDLLPVYRDLFWSGRASAVLAGNAALAWSIILLHELAHLVTARAAGVPGRMSLSTRLQFLAAQTDVSGIWAAPRRQRLAVYLSGLAVNVAVAATAVLVRAASTPGTVADRVGAATVAVSMLIVAPQLLVFMRTDVYFVLQDLAGCRNLYADGSAYVRWWARRLRHPLRPAPVDPGTALPVRERRAVRAYAVLLAVGTAACLAVAATVTVPFAVTVLAASGHTLVSDGSPAARADALLALVAMGGFWVLWCRAWWRRHGRRVVTWWSGRR